MKKIKELKIYFPFLFIPILLFFFGLLYIHNNRKQVNKKEYQDSHIEENVEKKEEQVESENPLKEAVKEEFTVDIKGRVVNAGVYTLEPNSRVIDVIKEAGGLLEDSNTSLINLSKKIEDEMVIIIYSNAEIDSLMKEEKIVYKIVELEKECPDSINDACIDKKEEPNDVGEKENQEEIKQVNLNTASMEELTKLPGIGEAKAQNIIQYRENFPFESIEQLKEVSGIGESLFEKVKDYLTV